MGADLSLHSRGNRRSAQASRVLAVGCYSMGRRASCSTTGGRDELWACANGENGYAGGGRHGWASGTRPNCTGTGGVDLDERPPRVAWVRTPRAGQVGGDGPVSMIRDWIVLPVTARWSRGVDRFNLGHVAPRPAAPGPRDS